MHLGRPTRPECHDIRQRILDSDGVAVMSGIIATILANPTVLAVLAGVAAVIVAIVRARRAEAAAEQGCVKCSPS